MIATAFFLGAGDALSAARGRQIGHNERSVPFLVGRVAGVCRSPDHWGGFDAFGVAFPALRHLVWHIQGRAGPQRLSAGPRRRRHTRLCMRCGIIYLFARTSLTVVARSAVEMRTSIAIGAFAGCVGILIHSIFDFPLRTTSNAIFFLILVVLLPRG